MLAGCKYVLAIVEGLDDAYLLGALVSHSYSFHYHEDMGKVYDKLRECIYERRECIVAHPPEGWGTSGRPRGGYAQ